MVYSCPCNIMFCSHFHTYCSPHSPLSYCSSSSSKISSHLCLHDTNISYKFCLSVLFLSFILSKTRFCMWENKWNIVFWICIISRNPMISNSFYLPMNVCHLLLYFSKKLKKILSGIGTNSSSSSLSWLASRLLLCHNYGE